MDINETPSTGRGFVGRLADPQVRIDRARAAGKASAQAQKPEGLAKRLIPKVDELTEETRQALMAALVLVESRIALEVRINAAMDVQKAQQ